MIYESKNIFTHFNFCLLSHQSFTNESVNLPNLDEDGGGTGKEGRRIEIISSVVIVVNVPEDD